MLCCLFLIISLLIFNTSINQRTRTGKNNISGNSDNKEETLSLTGMVMTSGLSDSEKKVLDIKADYQLIKGINSEDWPEKINGMFLENLNIDYSKYHGKCVYLTGKIKKGWEDLQRDNYEINGMWSYYRSTINTETIKPLEYKECIGKNYTLDHGNRTDNTEYKVALGTLNFTKRPAPDISEDIEIILDKPFIDDQNASGQPVITKRLNITPATDEIYLKMLENIGKKAEVSGYMVWGYFESRYLNVYSIQIK